MMGTQIVSFPKSNVAVVRSGEEVEIKLVFSLIKHSNS